MVAQGGRDGKVESADGKFAVRLSTDEKPASVTPEHLFGGAYAACFLGALKGAAERGHIKLDAEGTVVTARTHLDEDQGGGYRLNLELRGTIPGVSRTEARHLMNLAHQSCPYSKATRGNINVTLTLD